MCRHTVYTFMLRNGFWDGIVSDTLVTSCFIKCDQGKAARQMVTTMAKAALDIHSI